VAGYTVKYQIMGREGAWPEYAQSPDYDESPKYLSFGVDAPIMWIARDTRLGIAGTDYIAPVYYPGASIADAGLAWVYIRDQNNQLHATFELLAFAPMNFHNDGAVVTGGAHEDKLIPRSTEQASGPFLLAHMAGQAYTEQTITPEDSAKVWHMLAAGRADGVYIQFQNHATMGSFIGGLDVMDMVGFVTPSGFDFGATP
jgi:hypothetical protein